RAYQARLSDSVCNGAVVPQVIEPGTRFTAGPVEQSIPYGKTGRGGPDQYVAGSSIDNPRSTSIIQTVCLCGIIEPRGRPYEYGTGHRGGALDPGSHLGSGYTDQPPY